MLRVVRTSRVRAIVRVGEILAAGRRRLADPFATPRRKAAAIADRDSARPCVGPGPSTTSATGDVSAERLERGSVTTTV